MAPESSTPAASTILYVFSFNNIKECERLTGFFWFCIRAGWITQNPTNGLGRITVNQTPTDYFTRKEFDEIIDATYAYRENRAETGSANSARHAPHAMEWFAHPGCDHA